MKRKRTPSENPYQKLDQLLKTKSSSSISFVIDRLKDILLLDDIDKSTKNEAKYELGLALSQIGKDVEANAILLSLGFSVKLSPKIFRYDMFSYDSISDTTFATPSNKCIHSIASVVDNVLPTPLLQHIQSCFAPKSPFWVEHKYPTPFFFSYNINFEKRRNKSSNIMEQLLMYLRPIVEKQFPQVKDAVSAEWWAHCRDRSSGHQMHYDLDEKKLSRTGEVCSPLCSCVLYLSCKDEAAPTLVIDQRLGDAEKLEKNGTFPDVGGSLCFPRENRLLCFNGSQLHCVVPGIYHKTIAASESKKRITLMIGWWGVHPFGIKNNWRSRFLGPNMNMPSFLSDYNLLKWPFIFKPHREFEQENQAPSDLNIFPLTMIKNVWVPIKDNRTSKEKGKHDRIEDRDVIFVGGWFLQHLRDVDDNVFGIYNHLSTSPSTYDCISNDYNPEEVECMSISDLLSNADNTDMKVL